MNLEVKRTGLTAAMVAMISGKSRDGTTKSHTFRIGWPLMISGGPAPRVGVDLPVTPSRQSFGLKMARQGKEHSDKAVECLRSGDPRGAQKHLSKADKVYHKLYQAKRYQMKVVGSAYRFGR